jgi:hypothetical protein
MNGMIREAIGIELHSNMNKEDDLCLNRLWKPLIHIPPQKSRKPLP